MIKIQLFEKMKGKINDNLIKIINYEENIETYNLYNKKNCICEKNI